MKEQTFPRRYVLTILKNSFQGHQSLCSDIHMRITSFSYTDTPTISKAFQLHLGRKDVLETLVLHLPKLQAFGKSNLPHHHLTLWY